MKVKVHVFYKPQVFDPQGSAVESSLRSLGFYKISSVRVGKMIELSIDAPTRQEAEGRVKEMCEALLVNPVIESYSLELSG